MRQNVHAALTDIAALVRPEDICVAKQLARNNAKTTITSGPSGATANEI
jgi:hypothetical protein